MSLRNLNINVVPCYPVGDRNTGDIALTKIHTKFPVIEKEGGKYIKELFFTLFIEGIQDKSIEIDDEEVFSFDTNYEIKIRLMEILVRKLSEAKENEYTVQTLYILNVAQ